MQHYSERAHLLVHLNLLNKLYVKCKLIFSQWNSLLHSNMDLETFMDCSNKICSIGTNIKCNVPHFINLIFSFPIPSCLSYCVMSKLHTHQTVWGALVTALANNWPEFAQTGRQRLQFFLYLQFPGKLKGKCNYTKNCQIHQNYSHIHFLKLHPVASLSGRSLAKKTTVTYNGLTKHSVLNNVLQTVSKSCWLNFPFILDDVFSAAIFFLGLFCILQKGCRSDKANPYG